MKKILKSLMFVIGMFFMIIGVVKANTFYEGSYISGEYINKEIEMVSVNRFSLYLLFLYSFLYQAIKLSVADV